MTEERKHYWRQWAKAAAVRAIKTFAQTFVGVVGTASVLYEVDWAMVLSASALAALLSVLTSLGGLPEVQDGRD